MTGHTFVAIFAYYWHDSLRYGTVGWVRSLVEEGD